MVILGALYVARRESLRDLDSFRFGFGMVSYFKPVGCIPLGLINFLFYLVVMHPTVLILV
jgi:hypothetical protein